MAFLAPAAAGAAPTFGSGLAAGATAAGSLAGGAAALAKGSPDSTAGPANIQSYMNPQIRPFEPPAQARPVGLDFSQIPLPQVGADYDRTLQQLLSQLSQGQR